jgi:hypothetical protein
VSPAKGIRIVGREGGEIIIEAEQDTASWSGNLIIECILTRTFEKDGKKRKWSISIGCLPALPLEITNGT